MIGSISEPINVSNIASIPGGIVTSAFFTYLGNYSESDTIEPGIGYWVKVSEVGKLVLASSGYAIPASEKIRIIPTSEFPPPPPEGVMNVNEDNVPGEFVLKQNYPNPFNPITSIRYELPKESWVKLTVYNTLGEEVAILIDRMENAGFKSISFNAFNIPSGIYFYKLNAGSFTDVKKMVILK